MRATPYKKVRERVALVIPQIEHLSDITMNKEVLSDFLSPIANACTPKTSPMTDAQLGALSESVSHIKNKKLTKASLVANANRLIANWHFIRENMAIPEWTGEEEFTDVSVLALYKKRIFNKGRLYYRARIRTYTGLCAGLVFDTLISSNHIMHFLKSSACVSKYKCATEEVSGMEGVAVVSIAGKGQFIARLVSCSGIQQQHNKEICEARINPRKCKRPIPCHVCRSTVEQCPLAIWRAEETKNE